MKEQLNIFLLQIDLCWQNVEANLSKIEEKITQITNADIILLPEMFNTGFCPSANYFAESMSGHTVKWMKRISKRKKCAISGTLMIKDGGKTFNRLVWISKSGKVYTYDKRHLFSLVKEELYLSKGSSRLILEEQGWKICPLICYDLRFPVFSRNNIDYDVLIYLANWPIKRIDAWNVLLKARAIENQSYVIGVNRVGLDGKGVFFNGHSKVINAFGDEVVSANEDVEVLLRFIIYKKDLELKRRQMNFLKDRDKFTIQ